MSHAIQFKEFNQDDTFLWQRIEVDGKFLVRAGVHGEFAITNWEPHSGKSFIFKACPTITELTVEISDSEYAKLLDGKVARSILDKVDTVTEATPEQRIHQEGSYVGSTRNFVRPSAGDLLSA